MKLLSAFLIGLLWAIPTYSQDIVGSWYGTLKVQGTELPLVFNIKTTVDGYSATMDSPKQRAKDIPVQTTTFEKSVLTLSIPQGKIEYSGTLKHGQIEGTFSQMGQSFPMVLTRKEAKTTSKRPQEPITPYPYYVEEVSFKNEGADVELSGTLTLPKQRGKFPVVVLISGSGPQNRNEEMMGHKPFLVLADHLTRAGIGVLRYDDRGVAQSTGNFANATSNDFAQDVEAAVKFLKNRKEIDAKRIGLIGHSEGGLIAPMVASKDESIAFIVLMAGPGLPGDQILLMQQELVARASGVSQEEIDLTRKMNEGMFDLIRAHKDESNLPALTEDYIEKLFDENTELPIPENMTKEAFIRMQVQQVNSPWMLNFLTHEPAPVLKEVTCPILALNGVKDLQVPCDANLEAIEKAVKSGGNDQITTVRLEGQNHLFQECETGAPSEYAEIDQTLSPKALETMTTWILAQIK